MFCGKCGKQLNEGSVFCPFCGYRVPEKLKQNLPVQQTTGKQNLPVQQTARKQNLPVQQTARKQNRPVQQTAQKLSAQPAAQNRPPVGRTQAPVAATVAARRPVVTPVSGAPVATAVAAAAAVKKPRPVWVPIVSIVLAFVLVIVLVVGGAIAYLSYTAQDPRDTVERFFDAYNEMDINTMAECMCPKLRGAYKGAMGVGNAVLDAVGIGGINMGDVIGLAPFLVSLFGEELNIPKTMNCEIVDVEYKGGNIEKFPIHISGIEKALAKDAYVTVVVHIDDDSQKTLKIHLQRYGKEWLIEDDFLFN
ncbi:MAG: zinc-ribbon domain-containing protein [Lachnospiraceae bacterium]|nr:zinc-ribbon domain-containing protein [Lachnospiraceae bacterium]